MHRDNKVLQSFRYRFVIGMARYFSQLEYSGSRYRICSCHKTLVKHRMYAALGPVLLCGTLAGTSTRGIKRSQVFAAPNAWEVGWTAHGTKKHGWHFLIPSTTSAWPKVAAICKYRFVNVVFFWFTACAQNGPATRRPGIDIDIDIDNPTCMVSFPTIDIEQMDSKQESFELTMSTQVCDV